MKQDRQRPRGVLRVTGEIKIGAASHHTLISLDARRKFFLKQPGRKSRDGPFRRLDPQHDPREPFLGVLNKAPAGFALPRRFGRADFPPE